MENLITLKVDLPQEVVSRLETIIIDTVTRTLQKNVESIKAEPKMYTRKETAKVLRITLPTLRTYEIEGRLIPKRAGKRVLYSKESIELFIASLRP